MFRNNYFIEVEQLYLSFIYHFSKVFDGMQ